MDVKSKLKQKFENRFTNHYKEIFPNLDFEVVKDDNDFIVWIKIKQYDILFESIIPQSRLKEFPLNDLISYTRRFKINVTPLTLIFYDPKSKNKFVTSWEDYKDKLYWMVNRAKRLGIVASVMHSELASTYPIKIAFKLNPFLFIITSTLDIYIIQSPFDGVNKNQEIFNSVRINEYHDLEWDVLGANIKNFLLKKYSYKKKLPEVKEQDSNYIVNGKTIDKEKIYSLARLNYPAEKISKELNLSEKEILSILYYYLNTDNKS